MFRDRKCRNDKRQIFNAAANAAHMFGHDLHSQWAVGAAIKAIETLATASVFQ